MQGIHPGRYRHRGRMVRAHRDHEHHDHLVCSRCGKKVEFSYQAIEILQEAVAREHGFTLESHHFELIGICPDCLNDKGVRDKK